MKKDVALVLSSGGPRGWAYIGAIEELISRGYRIRSVAGTSIGSLIGGIYAAGKLEEIKEWLESTDYDVESYVIIDDEMWDIWDLHDGHMVQTSFDHGIKPGAVKMAIDILDKEDNPYGNIL
jgi:predicted acylesterase/phospholipase RssA